MSASTDTSSFKTLLAATRQKARQNAGSAGPKKAKQPAGGVYKAVKKRVKRKKKFHDDSSDEEVATDELAEDSSLSKRSLGQLKRRAQERAVKDAEERTKFQEYFTAEEEREARQGEIEGSGDDQQVNSMVVRLQVTPDRLWNQHKTRITASNDGSVTNSRTLPRPAESQQPDKPDLMALVEPPTSSSPVSLPPHLKTLTEGSPDVSIEDREFARKLVCNFRKTFASMPNELEAQEVIINAILSRVSNQDLGGFHGEEFRRKVIVLEIRREMASHIKLQTDLMLLSSNSMSLKSTQGKEVVNLIIDRLNIFAVQFSEKGGQTSRRLDNQRCSDPFVVLQWIYEILGSLFQAACRSKGSFNQIMPDNQVVLKRARLTRLLWIAHAFTCEMQARLQRARMDRLLAQAAEHKKPGWWKKWEFRSDAAADAFDKDLDPVRTPLSRANAVQERQTLTRFLEPVTDREVLLQGAAENEDRPADLETDDPLELMDLDRDWHLNGDLGWL